MAPPGISPGKTQLWPWKIPWPHRAMFMVGHPFHRLTPMTRMLPSYGSRRNMEFVMAGENGLFDSCTSEQDCWCHESKSGIKFPDESECYLMAFTMAAYKRWQPEQKTHRAFKCLSCLSVLKYAKFMTHLRNHLELERQKGDSWEIHTTCQHYHLQFPTSFQLQCHIESVHASWEPSMVCNVCQLSFKTDQVLLQHMKDSHKPDKMP